MRLVMLGTLADEANRIDADHLTIFDAAPQVRLAAACRFDGHCVALQQAGNTFLTMLHAARVLARRARSRTVLGVFVRLRVGRDEAFVVAQHGLAWRLAD